MTLEWNKTSAFRQCGRRVDQYSDCSVVCHLAKLGDSIRSLACL